MQIFLIIYLYCTFTHIVETLWEGKLAIKNILEYSLTSLDSSKHAILSIRSVIYIIEFYSVKHPNIKINALNVLQ